jgi:hypothetical protein
MISLSNQILAAEYGMNGGDFVMFRAAENTLQEEETGTRGQRHGQRKERSRRNGDDKV